MSAFSECLQNLKNVRGLRYADIAKMCDMDVTVVFRWMNGERFPESVEKLETIEHRLRLTQQEKNELEDAYMISVYGEEKFGNFKNVSKVINGLGKLRKYDDVQSKQTDSENHKNNESENTIKEFTQLHGKAEIIRGIGDALAILKRDNNKNIYLVTRVMSGEIETILSLYNQKVAGCTVEQIIYPQKNGVAQKHDINVEVLEKIINVAFQSDDMKVWIGSERDDADGMNQIISQSFLIQYNNDISEGMMTTHKEWIDMAMHTFDYLKGKSKMVGKKEIDGLQYAESDYRDNSVITTIEYQPCLGACLDEEILDRHFHKDLPNRELVIERLLKSYVFGTEDGNVESILNDLNVFFSKEGLRAFMETGIFEVFPYPFYTPVTMEERCKIVRRCVGLSKEGKNKHYLIKDTGLSKLKNIHIEYIRDDKRAVVRIDVNQNVGKERMAIKNESILQEFDDFFECIQNEKYIYSKEETEQYMLRVVEEYEKSYINN